MAPTGGGKAPRFLLTARALEPAWMAVRADGGQVREVLLQKGQTARFSAERGFLVTLGNAGGVDIQLNGERIPSLGASGQVIRDLALPPARPPRDPD
jgi:cytoskeleton protein RodZ